MSKLNLPNVLQCDSSGDKRFSAKFAKIEVYDKLDTIERHYQLCKRFGNKIPQNDYEFKGKSPTHIEINGIELDKSFLSAYYKLLWVKYLDANPNLVSYAKNFDYFVDKFRGKSVNCQADIIKQYVKEGRSSIMNDREVKQLCQILKK